MKLSNISARAPVAILALLAAASAPGADLLTGRVVNSQGVGVPNVDIDIESIGGGGDPNVSMDFTTAGGFFSVTVEPGTWQLSFVPPPPPTTTDLIRVIPSQTIVGTVNLGDVQLAPGVALSGRVVDAGGLPVAGVNLDVINVGTGENLELTGDNSNALGQFLIAVPAEPIEVTFDTTGLIGQTLASQELQANPNSALNLGDVVLPPGFTVSGVLLGPGATPVSNADLDFDDSATGQSVFTPKDHSTNFGTFSVIVEAGTYDIKICPILADRIVAVELQGIVVNGSVSLGAIMMQSGVVLSGTIRDTLGVVQPGADVDVTYSSTGLSVPLCGDNANQSGQYAVVVPSDTIDVKFEPASFDVPLGTSVTTNVVVAGDTVVDGTLPPCPFGSSYGSGLAGTGGFVPQLSMAGGAPRIGNDGLRYEMSNGLGGTVGILIIGLGQTSLPFAGGTLLVNLGAPNALLLTVLGGAPGSAGTGSTSLQFPLLIKPALVGLTLYAQYGLQDFGALQGSSLSNGFAVTLCD